MLDEIRQKIEDEIERLTHELNVELPQKIKTAMEHGDLRENSEYKAAKDRQEFVQARLNHLTITAGDFIDLDAGQVSLASPIGQGLLNAGEGEEVVIELPVGERRYKILELTTLPQQVDAEG